jgi:hypothetical protein
VSLNGVTSIKCRSYQRIGVPEIHPFAVPSLAYLSVILDGAIEHNFPTKYIEELKAISNNGIFDIPMLKNIESNKKEVDEPDE